MSAIDVVLLGANGQLGKTIAADWRQSDGEPAISLHGFDLPELDICQPGQIDDRLAAIEPQVIINTAAYTQVDKAETETDLASRVNRDGAAAVAEWAANNNCRLIHISTDFVFDGSASSPYRPEDPISPVNHYGLSKAEGESAVRQLHPGGSVIIRTSWLYSRYQPNFVITMLRLMAERDRLQVVADQVGTPTSTHSLTRLLRAVVNSDVASGTFHWSDAGVASWYDFAVAIQEEGLANGLLQSSIPVDPISSTEYPTPARRPAFSVLDKSASYDRFAVEAVHWRAELRKVIIELGEN
jgi:dTDP-4-dehydrorhamnose reductase